MTLRASSLLACCAAVLAAGCDLVYRYAARAGDGGATADSAMGFGDRSTADGARGDLAPDGPLPVDAGCAWGPFSTPSKLGGVNDANDDDWATALSADGLELFLSSWRNGTLGQSDLWRATRSSEGQPFAALAPLSALNTAKQESSPVLSRDGLTLLFTSDRGGKFALHRAVRPAPGAAFGPPARIDELSGDHNTWSAVLAEGGLRLYFTSDRGGGGSFDIWTATRSAPDAAFGAPVLVAELSSTADDHVGGIAADERELFFSSRRPGGKGGYDLYVARRAAPRGPFGAPELVVELNTAYDDLGGTPSADGTYLLYNRDTSFSGGRQSDVWIARRSCAR